MQKIIIILVTAFAFLYLYKLAPPTHHVPHENVVLYSTSWCGYCAKTREFLATNNIKYIEYDIETSEEGRKQHEQLGGSGVPVIDIKGHVIYGYSIKQMQSIFTKLGLM